MLIFLIIDVNDSNQNVHSDKHSSSLDNCVSLNIESKTEATKLEKIETNNELALAKQTSNKKSLYKRRDVINKALMRLIRKFFKSIYRSLQPSQQMKIKKPKKVKYFKTQIEQVVASVLDNALSYKKYGYTREQMFETIGRVIDTSLYSKLPKNFKSDDTENIKVFAKKFNDCCTKYTHSTFSQVLQMRYFKVVLDMFAE